MWAQPEATARALVARFSTCRAAIAAIVGITLVLSMIATNDMALIMMLPLCAATLLKAGWERALPFAFIMQSLAANLGGMIVPFGNPQNLYLFERFSIPLADFLAVMALPFAVSVLLIGACCAAFAKPAPRVPEARPAQESGRELGQDRPAPVDRRRALACGALLALVIASVFRLVPYPVALVAVVAGLLVLDRRALRSVDFGLLLTFACFFVFAGNMARMPAVEEVLSQAMAHNALLASAGASQIISNVPAAVLLSHFTDSYEALSAGRISVRHARGFARQPHHVQPVPCRAGRVRPPPRAGAPDGGRLRCALHRVQPLLSRGAVRRVRVLVVTLYRFRALNRTARRNDRSGAITPN